LNTGEADDTISSKMPSILLMVFLLQLSIHIVNTIGASTINNLLWNLYQLLPTSTSTSLAKQGKLRSDFLKVRREMNATSSQDQFAKWAKLRRKHDKVLKELEQTKSTTDSTRANFDRIVSALRWCGTNGARILTQFWFSKQPMFWIPKGWVPYYAEWLLSFPRAPLGSISVQAWALACGAVILLVSDAIIAVISLVKEAGTSKAQNSKGKPMAFSEEGRGLDRKSTETEAKKE